MPLVGQSSVLGRPQWSTNLSVQGVATPPLQTSAQSVVISALAICFESGTACRIAQRHHICAGLNRPHCVGTSASLVVLQAQPCSGTGTQAVTGTVHALGNGGAYELQLGPRQQGREGSASTAGNSEPCAAAPLPAARPLQRSLEEAVAAGSWRKAATLTEQLLAAGALGEELLSDQLIKGAACACASPCNAQRSQLRQACRMCCVQP